jgi:hypothetical protein
MDRDNMVRSSRTFSNSKSYESFSLSFDVTGKRLMHEAIMYPCSVCLVGSGMANFGREHHAKLTLDVQRSIKDEREQKRRTDEATIGTTVPMLSLMFSNTEFIYSSIVPYLVPCVVVELAVRRSIRVMEYWRHQMGRPCEGRWGERRKHAH